MRLTRHQLTDLWLWATTAGIVGFYSWALRRIPADPDTDPLSLTRATYGSPESPADLTPGARQWPRVSIIVPARNEERNIRGCVESLLAQTYPNFEVIVVDDASTDATPRILADLRHDHPRGDRLRVEHVTELPAGWAGKPHALHTGVLAAGGEWLLFTDADTRHSPQTLWYALRAAVERRCDLLSLETTQDLPDFWGRVLMPMAYLGISMQYGSGEVNNPESPVAIANGQYILIRRGIYEAVGGYASPRLRATLLDDRDLAVEVKRAHGSIALVPGRNLVHTRMYHSLREHWEGWGKNAYAGSRGGPLLFLAMIVGLPLICIVPFGLALAGALRRRPRLLLAGGAQVGAIAVYRAALDARVGVPRRYGWTHPLAAAIFTGILARSLWARLRGHTVAWRGRSYPL